MTEHNKLYKRYYSENYPTLKLKKYNKYKNARNFKVKKSKKEYYQNYFQKHSKNAKKIWDRIKSIVTFKSKDKTAPSLFIVNGKVIKNKNCIAKIFNDSFVVSSNLWSNTERKKTF